MNNARNLPKNVGRTIQTLPKVFSSLMKTFMERLPRNILYMLVYQIQVVGEVLGFKCYYLCVSPFCTCNARIWVNVIVLSKS